MESDVGAGVLQKQNPGIATVVKRKYAVGGVSFSEGLGHLYVVVLMLHYLCQVLFFPQLFTCMFTQSPPPQSKISLILLMYFMKPFETKFQSAETNHGGCFGWSVSTGMFKK